MIAVLLRYDEDWHPEVYGVYVDKAAAQKAAEEDFDEIFDDADHKARMEWRPDDASGQLYRTFYYDPDIGQSYFMVEEHEVMS